MKRQKSTLIKYVTKEYLIILTLIFLALSSIYTLIIFFEILDDALEFKAPLSAILSYLLLNQPIIIKKTLPLAIFFSTLAWAVIASRHFEFIALKALGVRLRVVMTPVIFIASTCVVVLLIWNLFIAPWSEVKVSQIRKVKIKKEHKAFKIKYTNIWAKKGDAWCFIKLYDERKGVFKGVKCFWIKKNSIYKMAWGAKALWRKKKWVLDKGFLIEIGDKQVIQKEVSALSIPMPLSPETLISRKKQAWEMNYLELKEYIEDMQNEGCKVPWLRMELYQRFGLAFTPLILVLLAFPFGVRPPREADWRGIIEALGILVLYWGSITIFSQLGEKGLLSPFFAAFIPHLLFLSYAIFVVKRAES